MKAKQNRTDSFGKISTVDYNQLQAALSDAQNIVITTHRSPDGDAIGSSLALAGFLKPKQKNVTVIVPDPFPNFLEWMEGATDIVVFESQKEAAEDAIETADVIFSLDYNRFDRVAAMGEVLKSRSCTKVMIDHHIDPDRSYDLILSDTSASSTAELVYRCAKEMNWLDHLNRPIAEALYAGIMTDTGSFKFSSTSAETHRIAAHLMEAGLVPEVVHQRIFDTNSYDRLQLLGYALSKKMDYDAARKVCIIALSLSEKNRFRYQKGDTEGLVNYGLSINGSKMAVFVSEELGGTKFSFRSKGDVNVNEIARAYFNGGGHKNAAGGRVEMKIKDAIDYLKDVIENKLDF